MALSPSIPTSFVPKQPVTPAGNKRYASSGSSILLIIGVVIFILAVAAAIGTFVYDQLLQKESNVKAQQILAKEQTTATTTLADLITLQNRLTAAESVITQHIALTQFFNLLSNITASDVAFNTVSITVNDDRSATLSLAGVAQNFNALENESLIFNQQTKYIKNPIFSGFTLNKDNTVSFNVTGTLDPSVVKESAVPQSITPSEVVSSVPVVNPGTSAAAALPSTPDASSNTNTTANAGTDTNSGDSAPSADASTTDSSAATSTP